MAHICRNYINIAHADIGMLYKFKNGIESKRLLEVFFPITSSEPGNRNGLNEWGTERDVIGGYFQLNEDLDGGFGVFYTFDLPPIIAFKKFSELNFLINVIYVVEITFYAGKWSSENGDEFIDFDLKTHLPPEYIY